MFAPGNLGQPTVEDIARAAAAIIGIDKNGPDRAVPGTRPAFHAGIIIDNGRLFFNTPENPVRTDYLAHPATNTGRLIKFEDGGAIYVSELFHGLLS